MQFENWATYIGSNCINITNNSRDCHSEVKLDNYLIPNHLFGNLYLKYYKFFKNNQ